MKLSLIVAAAANNVIGRENSLPWHLPQDLKYFKAQTLGKPIIMGRKTFESIGKPLPGRTNIVVTRQAEWACPKGVLIACSLDDAVTRAKVVASESPEPLEEIMVIGGAELYRGALPRADRVYLTRLEKDFKGDAYFPELSPREWKQISAISGASEALEPHTFLVFERIYR